MLTRKGAMTGILGSVVTAGMGFSMMAPMVAYASETGSADFSQMTGLSTTQKNALQNGIREAQRASTDLYDALLAIEGLSETTVTQLNHLKSLDQTTFTTANQNINACDTGSARNVLMDDKATIVNNLNDAEANLGKTKETGPLTPGSLADVADAVAENSSLLNLMKAYYQKLATLAADDNNLYDNVVVKNQDPETVYFAGFSPITTKAISITTTHDITRDEDTIGTYGNIKLDYTIQRDLLPTSQKNEEGWVVWTLPEELRNLGFTIVDSGMLAPQASEVKSGSASAAAPKVMISNDRTSIAMAISQGADEHGNGTGDLQFAIHTPARRTAEGQSIYEYLLASEGEQQFAHIPDFVAYRANSGAVDINAYTEAATKGTREVAHTFLIEFDTKGGSYIAPQQVTNGNFDNYQNWAGKIPAATRTGYKFAGWFTKPECTPESLFDPFKTELKNMTLYAKWEQNSEVKVEQPAASTPAKNNLVQTGEATTYIAATAAVALASGLAVTVFRRRAKKD